MVMTMSVRSGGSGSPIQFEDVDSPVPSERPQRPQRVSGKELDVPATSFDAFDSLNLLALELRVDLVEAAL